MKVSDELYNPGPLLTFEGAAIAVLTASGAIGYALEFNPKWLGLVIALLIPLGGLFLLPSDSEVFQNRRPAVILIALFHGLVIYNLSVGLNALHQTIPAAPATKASVIPMVDPVPWWTSAEQKRAAMKLIAAVRELHSSEEAIVAMDYSDAVVRFNAIPPLTDVKASERKAFARKALEAKAQRVMALGSLANLADDLERTYSGPESGRRSPKARVNPGAPQIGPTQEK